MFRSFVLASLAFTVSASAAPVPTSKTAELLVGTWEGVGGMVTITAGKEPPKSYKRNVVVTFSKDGKLTMVEQEIKELKAMNPDLAKGETLEGTYRFTGDNEIEVELKGVNEKMKAKVTVSATDLTVDAMGEKTTYTRVKK
jgi:hypothetical protein